MNVILSCWGQQSNPDGPERAERPLCQSQVDPWQVKWMIISNCDNKRSFATIKDHLHDDRDPNKVDVGT